jgi:hypothetical protein
MWRMVVNLSKAFGRQRLKVKVLPCEVPPVVDAQRDLMWLHLAHESQLQRLTPGGGNGCRSSFTVHSTSSCHTILENEHTAHTVWVTQTYTKEQWSHTTLRQRQQAVAGPTCYKPHPANYLQLSMHSGISLSMLTHCPITNSQHQGPPCKLPPVVYAQRHTMCTLCHTVP